PSRASRPARPRAKDGSMAGMGSVYPRGNMLWLGYKDGTGQRPSESSGYRVGQEAEAAKVLRRLEDQARAVEDAGGGVPLTLRIYARRWIERRAQTVQAWQKEQYLLRHTLDPLGDMLLDDI